MQGQDPDDPRASPLRGPMRAGPSLRIDVGADEVLLDDARTYAARTAQAATPVTLAILEGMPHVFQARCAKLAAARKSFDAAGRFLAAQFVRL
ncbi:alpha/beta hydrolase [Methylobacterium sp. J-077]|nr:alpha/beta hydrolase [Methylobacterium sp. J-077]